MAFLRGLLRLQLELLDEVVDLFIGSFVVSRSGRMNHGRDENGEEVLKIFL